MRIQTPFEEKLNAITHSFGVLFGIAALVLLIIKESHKSDWSLFSVIVYGISIIILFAASTLYHFVLDEKKKHYFRVLDHISIYILIAGTYTPILLISLQNSLGWPLFYTVWGIAAFGVILKIFFTGRFEAFSVILYLAMGWLVVFDFSHLSEVIGSTGISLLFAGGLAYTGGIIFYIINKIPYNHVIWHLFVLAGAIFHFFMVYFYVI
ncbi:hemolysin III family protein [Oceanihabitans sp. 2_MG-2023]|uniref:PAQR family membrane homeostasis protein TrhA n=1 Tax=Oceanihabitans sp. 2_MG-2023 TaxID=3062661 RepID=UPI0026E11E07|nr:hemolysin III family protein [Oceanihabitans sp. 2_MG-2023]MDO6597484.1 hemolysin III family protein [Oceanihabitans sp. 2_MG-2023]